MCKDENIMVLSHQKYLAETFSTASKVNILLHSSIQTCTYVIDVVWPLLTPSLLREQMINTFSIFNQ